MVNSKEVNLESLIDFFDESYLENAGNVRLKISKKKAVIVNVDKMIESIDIKVSSWLQSKIMFFPIIESFVYFKWIKCLPTKVYIFLFVYIVDENNILIFSNDILRYLREFTERNFSTVQLEGDEAGDDVFQRLTSSFYLFTKNDDTGLYEWKNILEFFPLFLQLSFQNDDYVNVLNKIKWDSVAFFKSRFVQEKDIKTIIKSKEEWTSFFYSMFYANILKNLTFRIAWSYIDLNARWKWGFHIATTKNSEEYFKKIQTFIETINQEKWWDKTNFPVFFSEWSIWKNNQEDLYEYEFIDIFPVAFKKDSKGNTYILSFNNIEQESDSSTDSKSFSLKFLFNEDWFEGYEGTVYDMKKKIIRKKYAYSLLEEKSVKSDQYDDVSLKRPVQDTDLYILFLWQHKELFIWKVKSTPLEWAIVTSEWWKKNKKEQVYTFLNMNTFFSGKQKIKQYQKEGKDCRLESHNVTLNKNLQINFKITRYWFYIDAYKLYSQFGKYVLDESKSILLRKKASCNDSHFYFWTWK